MFAAVMPLQVFRWHRKRQAIVKNTLQILFVDIVFIESVFLKEGGRRQLFWVSNDNDVLSSGNGTNRLTRRHLGSLVEYDIIELGTLGIDVLCHGNRAH